MVMTNEGISSCLIKPWPMRVYRIVQLNDNHDQWGYIVLFNQTMTNEGISSCLIKRWGTWHCLKYHFLCFDNNLTNNKKENRNKFYTNQVFILFICNINKTKSLTVTRSLTLVLYILFYILLVLQWQWMRQRSLDWD